MGKKIKDIKIEDVCKHVGDDLYVYRKLPGTRLWLWLPFILQVVIFAVMFDFVFVLVFVVIFVPRLTFFIKAKHSKEPAFVVSKDRISGKYLLAGRWKRSISGVTQVFPQRTKYGWAIKFSDGNRVLATVDTIYVLHGSYAAQVLAKAIADHLGCYAPKPVPETSEIVRRTWFWGILIGGVLLALTYGGMGAILYFGILK